MCIATSIILGYLFPDSPLYYIGLSISRQPHFAIFLAYYAVLNALDQNSDGVQIHFYA